MQIDMGYLDKLTQRVVQEGTKTYLRTYANATVVDEVELLNVAAGGVPSEINDLMSAARARAGMAYSGVSQVLGQTNPITGGSRFLINGPIISGEWVSVPALFKLLLNGTGDFVFDARDADGVITNVISTTLSATVNRVDFPYAGDAAMAVRASFPNTITCEVL